MNIRSVEDGAVGKLDMPPGELMDVVSAEASRHGWRLIKLNARERNALLVSLDGELSTTAKWRAGSGPEEIRLSVEQNIAFEEQPEFDG